MSSVKSMAYVFENDNGEDEPPAPPSNPQGNSAPSAPLSLLARRYGASKQAFFHNTGKSGITPIPRPDYSNLTPKTFNHLWRYEHSQRDNLSSFGSWEVVNSGSWIDNSLRTPDLDAVEIHPLYQQAQWIKGNLPIGAPFDGNWEANNPVVWKALLPCLKIATLLLETVTRSTW